MKRVEPIHSFVPTLAFLFAACSGATPTPLAIVITAYHPKIVPVLVFERFEGFGPVAAQPVAAILVLVALATFIFLRLSLLKENAALLIWLNRLFYKPMANQ